jgi:hypothetical protein
MVTRQKKPATSIITSIIAKQTDSKTGAGDEPPADFRRGGLAPGKELEHILRNDVAV